MNVHGNEDIKYANRDLPVNFWIFLLMSFCFIIKKDHLK